MITLSRGLLLAVVILLTSTYGPPVTELIPLIPPTALIGQPYRFQFIVIGMRSPRYEF